MLKKVVIILVAIISLFVVKPQAYTLNAWNNNYTITQVRQNGNGFWFLVVPHSGQSNEVNKYFGCLNTMSNYNTFVSMVLAAKISGRTVNFFVDSNDMGNGVASVIAFDIN